MTKIAVSSLAHAHAIMEKVNKIFRLKGLMVI